MFAEGETESVVKVSGIDAEIESEAKLAESIGVFVKGEVSAPEGVVSESPDEGSQREEVLLKLAHARANERFFAVEIVKRKLSSGAGGATPSWRSLARGSGPGEPARGRRARARQRRCACGCHSRPGRLAREQCGGEGDERLVLFGAAQEALAEPDVAGLDGLSVEVAGKIVGQGLGRVVARRLLFSKHLSVIASRSAGIWASTLRSGVGSAAMTASRCPYRPSRRTAASAPGVHKALRPGHRHRCGDRGAWCRRALARGHVAGRAFDDAGAALIAGGLAREPKVHDVGMEFPVGVRSTMMLLGLMSRWIRPCLCALCRASATCWMTRTFSNSDMSSCARCSGRPAISCMQM